MLLNYPKDIGNKILSYKSLTKSINQEIALRNTVIVGVSEVVHIQNMRIFTLNI